MKINFVTSAFGFNYNSPLGNCHLGNSPMHPPGQLSPNNSSLGELTPQTFFTYEILFRTIVLSLSLPGDLPPT